jgi:hypothetical protein
MGLFFYLYHLFYYPIFSAEIIYNWRNTTLYNYLFAIKGLKNKETGVTSKPDRFTKQMLF